MDFSALNIKVSDLDRSVRMASEPESGILLPNVGGRSSEPAHKTDTLLSLIKSEMGMVAPGFDPALIDICEFLAKFNGDVSYAVDNVVQLGNTPSTVTFDDSVKPAKKREMLKYLLVMENHIYSGGMNSLQNDLFAQAAITGAISAEIIPNKTITEIANVALVNPKDIRFKYNRRTYQYDPYQYVENNLLSIRGIDEKIIKLNTKTYKYYAVRRFSDNPHGIPPFISAFEAIEIEKDMMKNLRHIIRKMGLFGFLSVLVTPPRRSQNETDDQFMKRTRKYLEDIKPEVEKGYSNGVALGYKGHVEYELEASNSNIQGARDLMNEITSMKHAGLKQDPLMLGRNFNVAETMARVIMAKLTTQITNFQRLVGTFRSDLYYIMLRLAGFKLKTVMVEYKPPMIGDRLREAQAYAAEIENEITLRDRGLQSQQDAANELGFEEPYADRDVDYTVPHQDDISKIKDKPSATDPKNTKDPSQASDATGTPATNYSLDALYAELHGGLQEYPYMSACDCGNHSLSFAIEDDAIEDMQRFQALYGRAIVKLFKTTVDNAMVQVAEALAEFGEGASLQKITDRVFFILYKEWGTTFNAQQKVLVNKWVKEIYRYFRTDASIFGGKKVPEATFGLFDARAITYFQNSDAVYLGKFITDNDTRLRIINFLKEKYLTDGIALGDNKEAIDAFRNELGEFISLEDWKIRRIIETSVNRMRNTGAIAYMKQADISTFEIRGVNDAKQCKFCSKLQGKRFDVNTAFDRIEKYTKSMPELVGLEFPFVNTLFKGEEGFNIFSEMTEQQLQAAGVDIPPFHTHCRDVIAAVL